MRTWWNPNAAETRIKHYFRGHGIRNTTEDPRSVVKTTFRILHIAFVVFPERIVSVSTRVNNERLALPAPISEMAVNNGDYSSSLLKEESGQ